MSDKAELVAFCRAIDEGDASGDVVNFNAQEFIKEMEETWKRSNY